MEQFYTASCIITTILPVIHRDVYKVFAWVISWGRCWNHLLFPVLGNIILLSGVFKEDTPATVTHTQDIV
jgi:hypothetical protein